MAENTLIEWAHHTFNPWIGCQKVGPGCDHCYAEKLATGRLGVEWGPGAERRRTAASTWQLPRRWNDRAAKLGIRYRVFCSSLADVFDNAVSAEWRTDLADLIGRTPHLDWMLLTKRIGNADMMLRLMFPDGVPPNVWLGATIVNQEEADRDIIKLRQTRYNLRIGVAFLSMEPLLGPVNIRDHLWPVHGWWAAGSGSYEDAKAAGLPHGRKGQALLSAEVARSLVNGVIVGGESGTGARPLHRSWVRDLRDQCLESQTPFLFKQWGEWAPVCELTDEQVEALYVPAPAHDPERTQCCRVSTLVLHNDGERFDDAGFSRSPATGRLPYQSGFDGMLMFAVGKKAAGRLLDGAQHDAMPDCPATLTTVTQLEEQA